MSYLHFFGEVIRRIVSLVRFRLDFKISTLTGSCILYKGINFINFLPEFTLGTHGICLPFLDMVGRVVESLKNFK